MQIRQPLGLWDFLQKRCKFTMSQMLQPFEILPPNKQPNVKDESACRSSKLLLNNGFVRHAGPGLFYTLPLGLRVQDKLCKLIDIELKNIGCQRMSMPYLTQTKLWQKTNRIDLMGKDILQLVDRRDRQLLLSPTHEEAVTDFVANLPTVSVNQLPLRLYQITTKFRDEARPKFGLIRACEFLMQDLYTFDKDLSAAEDTYKAVSMAYENIFKRLNVPFTVVEGDCGNMGGATSHEYHFPADIGQDTLLLCSGCRMGYNTELKPTDSTCPKCNGQLLVSKGIEVAHTFLLGTRYSNDLNARYADENGQMQLYTMGSYGIGVSRVLAAAAEVLSTPTELRWPIHIAPFTVAFLAPKQGSKEELNSQGVVTLTYKELLNLWNDDIILDDRGKLTIGKKLREARKTGYPYIVLAGKKCAEKDAKFELHILATNEILELRPNELVNYLRKLQQSDTPNHVAT